MRLTLRRRVLHVSSAFQMSDSDPTVPLLGRNRPSRQSTSRGSFKGATFVLIVQFLHGVSYAAMFAHALDIWKDVIRLTNVSRLGILIAFNVCVGVTNLVAGWYADTVVGAYWTIFYANLINFIGVVLENIIVFAHHYSDGVIPVTYSFPMYTAAEVFMGVSRGFMIPSIVTFGAQQVDQSDHAKLSSYFRWALLCYHLGAYFVYCPLAFIIKRFDLDPLITNTVTVLIAESLAWAALIIGKKTYVMASPAQGQASVKEILNVFRKVIFKTTVPLNEEEARQQMSIVVRPCNPMVIKERRLKLRKMILMFGIFAAVGVYTVLGTQTQTTYVTQGMFLDDSKTRTVPLLFISSFLPLAVILPVLAFELYRWRCSSSTWQYKFYHLKLIGVGLLFGLASILCADYIEIIWRLWKGPCTVFCQLPQYVLMGLGHFLVYVQGFEFCYRESWPGLQSMATGFFFGVGSLFTVVAITIPLMVSRLSGHGMFMELFSTLAGIMLFTTICIFYPIARWYTNVREELQDLTLSISSSCLFDETTLGRHSLSNRDEENDTDSSSESDESTEDTRHLIQRFHEGKNLYESDKDLESD